MDGMNPAKALFCNAVYIGVMCTKLYYNNTKGTPFPLPGNNLQKKI
jgi:hypothetical protein